MALQHARSGQVVRIPPMSDPSSDGRTTAMIKADQLEVVRIVLPAGKVFPEHRVQGEITVFCLEGRILFRTPAAGRALRSPACAGSPGRCRPESPPTPAPVGR